jgi:hypothetical protein
MRDNGSLDMAGQDVHLSADHFTPKHEAVVLMFNRIITVRPMHVHEALTEPHISVQKLPSTVVWCQKE